MKTVEYNYNRERIEFFLKTDNPKGFVSEHKFTPFGGNLEPLDDDQIIKTGEQSGTFMRRKLALKLNASLMTPEDSVKYKKTDW